MKRIVQIGNRKIGDDHPVYIIAELSANHNGSFDTARRTIDAMKEAGADAVKFQTYTPDTITLNCDSELFLTRKESLGKGRPLYDLYKEAYMPWDWQPKLMQHARDLGLEAFSSPFDFSAVDFLEELNVPAYKIASLEIVDLPLIQYVASKQKPLIISTGIALEEDIQLALNSCYELNNKQIILLKCTSAYPTPLEDVNLKAIYTLQQKFKIITGLSDHTLGTMIPVAAAGMGARVIEKHFILDRKMGGVDSSFSLNKEEFAEMVKAVRNLEKALGSGELELSKNMVRARTSARSLFVAKDIGAGEELTKDNIRSVRPAAGLHPKYFFEILGRKAKRNLKKGTPLSFDLID